MHKLLERQLKKLERNAPNNEVNIEELLKVVDASYQDFDKERQLSDRAMQLVSTEVMELNERVRRQSVAEINAISNNVVDGIIRTDNDAHIIAFNKAAENIFGYTTAEILGKPLSLLFSPAVLSQKMQAGNEVAVEKRTSFETTAYKKNGDQVDVELSISRLAVPEAQGFFVLVRDITERKWSERELRRSYKALADLREAIDASSFVSITDDQGVIIYVNENFCRVSKYSRGELLGANHRIVKSDYHDAAFFENLWATITAGNVWKSEVCNRAKDGSIYWVDNTIIPFIGENGKPIEYMSIRNEITERKRAEEQLHESQKLFKTIAQTTPAAILFTRIAGGSVIFANDTVEALLGISAKEIVGTSSVNFYKNPDDREKVIELLRAHGSVRDFETQAIHQKTGKEFWVLLSLQMLTFQGEECIMAIVIDISGRKKAEEELRIALQKEKELSELKSRFVSMVSHEFRTPLASLLSSAELLERYTANWNEKNMLRAEKHFDRIREGIARMTELLEDVLIIGKAEAGKLEFNPSFFNINAFALQIIDELESNLSAKHPNFVYSSEGDVGEILADQKLLRHILTNLLSNAVKYSPEGNPVLFSLVNRDNRLSITIRDSGIGIPPNDLDRLFEPFHRAQNVGGIQGTGLGLAIVRRCAESHGGVVFAMSEIGVGTTFTVHLPFIYP